MNPTNFIGDNIMPRNTKLEKLMELEGYTSLNEFMGDVITDSINPGICSNPHCSYPNIVEPDSTEGYCESCGTNTVVSATHLLFYI